MKAATEPYATSTKFGGIAVTYIVGRGGDYFANMCGMASEKFNDGAPVAQSHRKGVIISTMNGKMFVCGGNAECVIEGAKQRLAKWNSNGCSL